MIRPEADFLGKWCPFARAHDVYSANRDADGTVPSGTTCIGSRCAAWRWVGWMAAGADIDNTFGSVTKFGDDDVRLGRCGLAR